MFKPVHVKTATSRLLRAVLAARQLLRNKLQDVENEIRGLIRDFGYHLGKVTRRDFEAYVRELTADTDSASGLGRIAPSETRTVGAV